MADKQPEPWLRGRILDVPDLLQPVAHALIFSRENIAEAVQPLSYAQLWHSAGGAASAGFHLRHLAGSTDRLMTYARGEELNEGQRAQLALEKSDEIKPDADSLLGNWSDVVETALDQLKGTSESELTQVRHVGRSRLESTVLGLLFHAAEHASRHTGQIVTTAIMVRSSSLAE